MIYYEYYEKSCKHFSWIVLQLLSEHFQLQETGGEKKLKFQESQALTCDYFDTFPTSGWHDLNYLGKVFVAFYGIVQGSEPW